MIAWAIFSFEKPVLSKPSDDIKFRTSNFQTGQALPKGNLRLELPQGANANKCFINLLRAGLLLPGSESDIPETFLGLFI
jgi:hypothetical protein